MLLLTFVLDQVKLLDCLAVLRLFSSRPDFDSGPFIRFVLSVANLQSLPLLEGNLWSKNLVENNLFYWFSQHLPIITIH